MTFILSLDKLNKQDHNRSMNNRERYITKQHIMKFDKVIIELRKTYKHHNIKKNRNNPSFDISKILLTKKNRVNGINRYQIYKKRGKTREMYIQNRIRGGCLLYRDGDIGCKCYGCVTH